MKNALISRIAGAALAVTFATQNTQAQELKPHAGLLFNNLLTWDEFKTEYPDAATHIPVDKQKTRDFAAAFHFSLKGEMYHLAIVCDYLRDTATDEVAKPYMSMMRSSGELTEMSADVTRGALRGAAAACRPAIN